jgi:hypothetical protein
MEKYENFTYPDIVRARKKSSSYKTVVSIFLFLLALATLFFTLNYLFDVTSIFNRISIFSRIFSFDDPQDYVSTYLSRSSKLGLRRDVIILLGRKGEELNEVKTELQKLEEAKKSFLDGMNEKKTVFHENIAAVDAEGSSIKMKSIVQLNKRELRFKTDIEKRIAAYMEIYQQKAQRLMTEHDKYEAELAELTNYIKDLEKQKGVEAIYDNSALFVEETKRRYYERLLFLIEQEEYRKAVSVLQTLQKLEYGDGDQIDPQENILVKLLSVVEEYQYKLNLLEKESDLEELKMAYLAEDYKKSLTLIKHIEAAGFMRPVLAELKNTLYENIGMVPEIAEEIGLKGSLKDLMKKAQNYEKTKEYEKALKIYEDLLILNLPPYDREYIIQRIHSIIVLFARNDIKREENTKAIKYLEDARKQYREGSEKESAKLYRTLITECPNSDYVTEALDGLINIEAE